MKNKINEKLKISKSKNKIRRKILFYIRLFK